MTARQLWDAWMRWPQWGRWASIGAVLVLVLIVVSSAGSADEQAPAQVQATVAATQTGTQQAAVAVLTATAQITAVPATATQPPAPTEPPATATPPPPPTPYPFTTEDIARSIRDNRSFMGRTNIDNLNVTVSGGLVTVGVKPGLLLNEADALTVASHTGLVASKAVWSTYPEAQTIRMVVFSDFTSAVGNTATESAAQFDVTRAIGEQFNYDGLKTRVISDNKHMFCLASAYRIHLGVYRELKETGCLRSAVR